MQDKQWNDFVRSADGASFLQAWQWAEVKSANGWQSFRFKSDDGGAQVLTKAALKGKLKIGYAPRGPLFVAGGDPERVITDLTTKCIEHNIDHITVDVQIDESLNLSDKYVQALDKHGFKKNPHYLQKPNTGIIHTDSFKDRDELLAKFNSSRRRLVRKTLKSELFSVYIEGQESIEEFHELYLSTGAKKGFNIRSAEYMKNLMRLFSATDDCFIIAARGEQGEMLAGGFFIGFGASLLYFYGASCNDRKLSEASNLVQLHGIEQAKSRGYNTYDFGGAPDDPDDSDDPFMNVWTFKRSLGAQLLRSPGCWEKPMTAKGSAYQIANKARKHLKLRI